MLAKSEEGRYIIALYNRCALFLSLLHMASRQLKMAALMFADVLIPGMIRLFQGLS